MTLSPNSSAISVEKIFSGDLDTGKIIEGGPGV
jgi:hypothetical protein